MAINREISGNPANPDEELILTRTVQFTKLPDENIDPQFDNCLRVYGSHGNATIQLRTRSSLTATSQAHRFIATADYLNRAEVCALIERLQAIEPTLR